MRPRFRPAATVTAALSGALTLCGCELALHEVQQATAEGCDPWQTGCPAVIEYGGREPVPQAGEDASRREIVSYAAEAPYRSCDTIGLVCQGRIMGDVLWDQYVMVVAGQSQLTSTAASAERVIPAAEARPSAPATAAPHR